ncbi:MAG: hypothetical protein Q9220_000544 [cf. Caloplaca sp. 1 TL-2023]
MGVPKVISYIFILATLLHFHRASSDGLPAPSRELMPSSIRNLDPRASRFDVIISLSTNIENLVRTLNLRQERFFNQASLQAVYLAVNQGQQPSGRIAEFRHIYCTFAAGGNIPEGGVSGFAVENQFPLHWDRWQDPTVNEASPHFEELQWMDIQALMSIERADQLLKAAGHTGPYYEIVIVQYEHRPLGYCFIMEHAPMPDWLVAVETGEVFQVPACTY